MHHFDSLFVSLWQDLHDVRVLWELAVVAVSIAIAWWASRLPLTAPIAPAGRWRHDAGGLRSVRFALTALLLVMLGRWLLTQSQNVALLNLAVPLLVALAMVRIVFYALPLIFAPGAAMSVVLRMIAWLVWIGVALHLAGVAPDLLDFLEATGMRMGKQRVSLLLILQTLLTVTTAVLLSLWLGRVLETRVMAAASVDINLRVVLAKLMRPLLAFIVVLIALPMAGIDLTALSVFGGAIGVGIGFGLQKIASNYVSGFIILLDRSVTIGDFLTIDKYSGRLTKMTARYVVVRSTDGAEIIIPNETVITSNVVKHSSSEKTARVPIAVQVSYRSDLDLAMRVLLEIAQAHPKALKHPAPNVLITAFAESGVNLELGVWVKDPEDGRASTRSDILLAIWREFHARGIEIPSPQLEVSMRAPAGAAPTG